MAYVRTVKTASGATAVQHSSRRGSRDIEHIGSAHDDAELEALNAAARQRLAAGQIELDLGLDGAGQPAGGAPPPITSSRMGHLWDALCRSYEVLGFEQATSGDEVFRQLVLARIIEPASKLGSLRVLDLRRRFSNVTPTAKSLVKRLLQRIGKTGQVRTDPKFEDARGPNVRELRCVQRRLSPAEVEGLLADYEAGGWVGELPRTYGIHRTTVSAHIARTGKTRPRGRVAAETLDS